MSLSSGLNNGLRKCKIMVRVIIALVIFVQASLCITSMQVIVRVVYHNNVAKRHHGIDFTKKAFISMLISTLHLIAPSAVRVTTDNNSIPKGTFYKDLKNGRIASHLKRKSVIVANHQIYTDWVFLWWLTSTADLAGKVYIILKKSLEYIPILGFGMRNYKFIFMCRKWEQDRLTLHNSLGVIDANSRGVGPISGRSPVREDADGEIFWDTTSTNARQESWPYCLILFPEGTNLSPITRQRSFNYANKIGKTPFENVLLPHATGARHSLLKLRPSLDVVYDITIGYSGVKKGEYGEALYTLNNVVFKGESPKLVDMHIKAYHINEIPIDDEQQFSDWLYDLWAEKDRLMNVYYEKGTFDLDPDPDHTITGEFKISAYPFFSCVVFINSLVCLPFLIWYLLR
ncbi:hypothetical protein ZYGR_0A01580 [Zygosaccharomyces rouxii]|uniref:ZYRO0A03586p n=2 Tax=Zygosaccharomyces rouxii TaxID=4956 RepID=C5DPI2_ZYGRC|nr:uncharacterized protein ZYRO0A03586g [Zygosaccharomyces rouxii]KAH9198886.1 acyltransferase-domain-containing protein [Zygosaccharomyces rouxii]GAV46566.1 hypothetical protein ZYGR_0A01580 [Zygosaccharomyces rouxii]CAR25593.1 ZYRO0A03586p [Zygosaccharomyces rouxii]